MSKYIKMFMTRDRQSEYIDLWDVKPTQVQVIGRWDAPKEGCRWLRIPGDEYPDITWENCEPSECEMRYLSDDRVHIRNVVIKGQLPF